jgi:dTDP-glucose 4,6-dehydratase
MKVLVTGAAGFIGHHVVSLLLTHTDWKITIIDRLDTSGNLNRLAEVGAAKNPRVRFIYHDLRAPFNDQLLSQIGAHDYIVHLAAATHVDRSIDNPMEFVQDNVVATCNILDFARKTGCSKFLNFSTDEVFGPAPEGVAYKEYDRYNSGNPYSATKAGAEELAVAYANTYKLPVITTHTMNVIGYRQHPEKYVPKLISKISKGEVVTVHATPDLKAAGTRFYIDARDVAEAVLLLLIKGELGKYNIVGERETSNLELAKWVALSLKKHLFHEMVNFHQSRPGHDLRYALDGGLMMEKFGWEPKASIRTRVHEIVQWTMQNPHWLI